MPGDACGRCHQDHLGPDFDLLRLDPDDFDLVLASPRRRAQHTAQLAGFSDVETDDDLRELVTLARDLLDAALEGLPRAEPEEGASPPLRLAQADSPGGPQPSGSS